VVNPVCYFEIPVADLDRAAAFYTAVFGVALEKAVVDGNHMAVFPLDPDKPGVGGALACGDSYIPGRQGARVYFRTASIADSLGRAVAAGGRQLYPETAVPGLGWVAEFEDSEGNCIALFTPLPDAGVSDGERGGAGDDGA
jgi:predicted enzyme related to lactoylglutathione lyase